MLVDVRFASRNLDSVAFIGGDLSGGRFLVHAKELLFLRQVGGGYIFVHLLLQSTLERVSATGVFATHQTATTWTLRPDATTSRFMPSGSLVRIVACWRRAIVTTTASMTSAVPLLPSSRPASCASLSSRGTTAQPVRNRLSWACLGDRLTWATTGAGTAGITPSSKRALCSAHVRRSFRSAATRTAAS